MVESNDAIFVYMQQPPVLLGQSVSFTQLAHTGSVVDGTVAVVVVAWSSLIIL